jgi:hypothetical protein
VSPTTPRWGKFWSSFGRTTVAVRWLSSGGIGEEIDGSFIVLGRLLICME